MSPLAVYLQDLWRCVRAPLPGFRARVSRVGTLAAALARMVALRAPLTLAGWVLTIWAYADLRQSLMKGTGTVAELLMGLTGAPPQDLRIYAEALPAAPPLAHLLPWLLPLAPVAVLSLWLHHLVWDHACLWMLGGLTRRKGWRATGVAEAEALQVGAFGAALALLGDVPGLGFLLGLPLALLGIYFWILRGFALAAWHDCPPWKGVLATLLHALLAGITFLGLIALSWSLAPGG
jgi:hypothetical protein